MTCKHEFIGTPEGVKCLKCCQTFTAREYAEYCSLKKHKDSHLEEFENLPSESAAQKIKETGDQEAPAKKPAAKKAPAKKPAEKKGE